MVRSSTCRRVLNKYEESWCVFIVAWDWVGVHVAGPGSLVMGHMRMGVVGGITVGVMMRQRASIGDSWGGRHMVGNGWSVSNQRGSMSNHRGSMGVDNGCGMMDSGGALVDDCVETVVVIGGVLNGTDRTIGFNQRVGALDNIAIAHLMLRLHITSVGVSNTVVVVVLGIRLPRDQH